jgi:hypothetical protein
MVAEKYAVDGGHDWKSVWIVPAIIAAAVLLLFALLFKERKVRRDITEAEAEKGLATSPIT